MLLAILFVLALTLLGHTARADTPILLSLYGLSFAVYIAVAIVVKADLRTWLIAGFAARIALVFAFPRLSDDIYRYLWDGLCFVNGINPFCYTPSGLLAVAAPPFDSDSTLLRSMNSPDYFTVYPPLAQYVFAFVAFVAGESAQCASILIKALILGAELASVGFMLRVLGRTGDSRKVLLYALNPLVIIELSGNAHLEAFAVLGFAATLYFLVRAGDSPGRMEVLLASSSGFLVAVATKLNPAILLPYLLRRIGIKSTLITGVLLLAGFAILALPFVSCPSGLRPNTDLGLYFQTFEFNASIYYLVRWIGYLVKGYNNIAVIGPALALVTVALLFLYLVLERNPVMQTWPAICLGAMATFLFLTPIVHPWYICPLVAMSIFTRFRFAVVWSFTAFLSYAGYGPDGYSEVLWLTACGYTAVLGTLIYEAWFATRTKGTGAG